MPTTVKDVKKYLEQFNEEDVLNEIESLHVVFDDLEYITVSKGPDARWGRRDRHVYEVKNGHFHVAFIGVEYYNIFNTMEFYFEGEVMYMKREIVKIFSPLEDDA